MTNSMTLGSAACLCALMLVACSGDNGKKGEDGADGMPGADGAKGDKGDPGEQGDPGPMGAMGAMGAMGLPGVDGEDGDAGADGEDGEDGEDGAMGAMGLMGTMGLPGESGIIDRTKLTGNYVVYTLDAVNTSGVSGEVRFAEFVDGTTTVGTLITVKVTGTPVPNTIRAAHVHYNAVGVGSNSIAITLNKVDGFTDSGDGFSETLVTHVDAAANNTLEDVDPEAGAAVTYAQLLAFNGLVNVHTITGEVIGTGGTVAAGNIGENGTPTDSVP